MFRHVGIVVNNMQKMKDFYCNVFDLEVLYDEVEQGPFLSHILGCESKAHIIKLGKNGKIFLELLDFVGSEFGYYKGLKDEGITHFAVTVDDADSVYRKAHENKSYHILNAPRISESGAVKVFFCADPEFNHIEIVQEL